MIAKYKIGNAVYFLYKGTLNKSIIKNVKIINDYVFYEIQGITELFPESLIFKFNYPLGIASVDKIQEEYDKSTLLTKATLRTLFPGLELHKSITSLYDAINYIKSLTHISDQMKDILFLKNLNVSNDDYELKIYTQLKVITYALNGGIVRNTNEYFTVTYDYDEEIINISNNKNVNCNNYLLYQSKELAEYSVSQFYDTWINYFVSY